MAVDVPDLVSDFKARYSAVPRVFRAPGRVNLIGEHTDYNDGFVLPAAIGFGTYVAASPGKGRRVRVASRSFGREFDFSLDNETEGSFPAWTRYVQGVALIIERKGYPLGGADILIDSDVPIGAGMSSSAALEISVASAFAGLFGHRVVGMELARIGQSAEHEFAGVRSGIMDQFAAVHGIAGHALFLDCRSLEWEPIAVGNAKFVVCNTKVRHDLAEGKYNKRRTECEQASALFGKPALRDVSLAELDNAPTGMAVVLKMRARHIVTENERVLAAVQALKSGDLTAFGKLMNASHESLRDNFEVSCPELDSMVEIARRQPGVLGARMMGGGFGGCTINLIRPEVREEFTANVISSFKERTGIAPEVFDVTAGDGVEEIALAHLIETIL